MAHFPESSERSRQVYGRFGRVLFRDEDSGNTLALFRTEDGALLRVSGYFTQKDLTAREVTLQGQERSGGKGPVFRVPRGSVWRGAAAGRGAPPLPGIEAVITELFRGHHFGPVSARDLCQEFSDRTWQVLTREPYVLADHVGGIDRAMELHRVLLDFGIPKSAVFAHLMHLGLSFAYARRVFDSMGTGAIEALDADPYAMIGVPGIRFSTADRIARDGFGVDPEDPRRLRALAVSVLEQAAGEGHTSLPLSHALRQIGDLIDMEEIDASELDVLQDAIADGVLHEDMGDVYLPRMLEAEERAADGLAKLLLRPAREFPFDLENAQELEGYTSEQGSAVEFGLTSPIVFISGRPGTGKTTVVEAIARLAQRANIRVTLAATTGNAADRMTEAILSGAPAVQDGQLQLIGPGLQIERAETIQSIVGNRGAGRPLPPGIVIIDEFSMADLPLLARIVDNAGPDTTLVFLGDQNQLPPVLAGNSSRDIRAAGVIPSVELTKVHRQGKATLISINADRILAGEKPIWVDAKNPGGAEAMVRTAAPEAGVRPDEVRMDSFFVDAGDIEAAPGQVMRVVHRLRDRGYDLTHDVQIYTPMHRGYLGTRNLNRLLQADLNPKGEVVRKTGTLRLRLKSPAALGALNVSVGDRVETDAAREGVSKGSRGVVRAVGPGYVDVEAAGTTVRFSGREVADLILVADLDMRVGDPVLQTRNDRKRRLTNGMRGVVTERILGGGVRVDFDGRIVEYTAAQARKLAVAYAATIHKSQGQEQPVTVGVLHHSEHARMLERSLLYVAHTRPKEKFICVGTHKAVHMALRSARGQERKTRLAERVSKRVFEIQGMAGQAPDEEPSPLDEEPFGLFAARTAALLEDDGDVRSSESRDPSGDKEGRRRAR